jgi:HEAT repeat protein
MRKSVLLLLAHAVIVLVVGAIIFDAPLAVEGWLSHESFFAGKPTTYWKHQLERTGREFQLAQAEFRRKGTEGLPVLTEILKDGTPAQRQGALTVLRGMGPAAKEAVSAVYVLLADKDGMARVQAAEAVYQISRETDELVPVLIQALQDDRDEVRNAAAQALGRIGPAARESVPALVLALQENQPAARAFAAKALGWMGPAAKDAVPALEEACKDPDPNVGATAVNALRRIRFPQLFADQPAGAGVP